MSSTLKAGTIEPAPPIAALPNTQWTRPDYQLPTPSLQFLFHLECDLEDFKHIGPGPFGNRTTVLFKGGRFEGPRLRGTIMPGGGDWLITTQHEEMQTAHLNTRYNLLTHDGATIYIQTSGTSTGETAVYKKLNEDPSVKADQYRMRLNVTLEAGDPRYRWVNDGVFIASCGRSGKQVIYDAYQVL